MYDGKPWDMAAVRDLGMKLTVDKNGNDATSADFDPEEHRPVGLRHAVGGRPLRHAKRPSSARARSSRADGKTAQITDQFKTGLKWFNDGVWKDHFIPTFPQIQSDLLGKGNQFQSGNLAMADTPQLVHVLHQPGRAGQAQLQLGRRGHPGLQRR